MPQRQVKPTLEPGREQRPQPPEFASMRVFLLGGVGALGLGILGAFWPWLSLLTCALGASLLVIFIAHRGNNALVTALALILFWLPFNTTFSRFGISPQEIAVYSIWLVGAFFSPLGARKWVWKVLTSFSPLGQFLLLLFTLACLQSLLRIPHPSLLDVFNNLRQILIYPVGLALLVAYAIRTRYSIRVFWQALVGGGVLFAIYALLLRVWGTDIANGSVAGRLGAEVTFLAGYHPNNLGLYLALALACMPALIRDAWNAREARLARLGAALLGTALMGLALWLTYSRGALVALLLGLATLLFSWALFSGTRARLASLGLVGLGVISLGVFIAINGVSALGRYAGLLDTSSLSSDPDVQFRESLYSRALNTATTHLFTGTGLGSFSQGAAVPFSPHNTYLDLWVSIGLFGASAFVGLLALGMVSALRAAKHLYTQQQHSLVLYILGLVGALVAFLAQAFTETFEQQPRIAPAIWVLVACADSVCIVLSTRKPQGRPDASLLAAQQILDQQATESTLDTEAVEPPAPYPQSFGHLASLESGPMPTLEPIWKIDTLPMPRIEAGSTSEQEQPETPGTRPKEKVRSGRSGSARRASQRVAEDLVKRAPANYLWNQMYTLWFFAANFLLSIVLTRGLSSQQYGIYAVLTTIVSTLVFVFALGLEDVATVFVPRVLTRGGPGSAGRLMRRLLLFRLIVIGGGGAVLTVGVIAAMPALSAAGLLPDVLVDQSRHFAELRVILMAIYLVGSSLVTLENIFFLALLRSRITFIIGGTSQILNLVVMFLFLKAGYGADGAFAALGLVAWFTAIAYLVALAPLLRLRGRKFRKDERPMRRLGISAWLTNIANSALGKQMDIVIMTIFAISYVQIGYYNLAYQLTNIAGLLLISGLGGVGMAAMSAALAAGGKKRLASMWRAAQMLQVLFSVPLLILCLVRSDQIVTVLYGAQYEGTVPLFCIFIVFTIVGRLVGGGIQQSALYVVGHQRAVLVVRGAGLVVNAALDLLLIPFLGPVGALLGTGFSQVWVGAIEYLLARRFIMLQYPLAFTWRVVGTALIAALLLLWWTPPGFPGLIISTLLFTVVMVVGLLTLKAGEAEDLQEMLKASPRLEKFIQAISRRLPHARVPAAPHRSATGAL